jgi:hypothetical protein
MAFEEEDDTTTYRVVVNHEEQYSIWPDYKDIPLGWQDGTQSRVPGLHRRSLDRHATTEPAEEDGRSGVCAIEELLTWTNWCNVWRRANTRSK